MNDNCGLLNNINNNNNGWKYLPLHIHSPVETELYRDSGGVNRREGQKDRQDPVDFRWRRSEEVQSGFSRLLLLLVFYLLLPRTSSVIALIELQSSLTGQILVESGLMSLLDNVECPLRLPSMHQKVT